MPGATGALWPTRSPLCGMAWPLREMRAPTTTGLKAESLVAGDIAIESSSLKLKGPGPAPWRWMASGMRGPCAARAKTNKVSPGCTRAASSGAMNT